MSLLYNLSISLTLFGLRIIAPFNGKIRLWLNGRQNWLQKLQDYQNESARCNIWFHCASLGEYEQGKPVMQALKQAFPQVNILVTFFSPSGYEARKNSTLADYVGYLPADTIENANDFLETAKPKLAIFVKSEIWPNFIISLKEHRVPSFLISARFYEGQSLFKNNRKFFRKQLKKFDFIFVQDKASQKILKKHNIESVLAGDTRFDQVPQLLSNGVSFPIIEKFKTDDHLLIVGSCWEEDLEVLLSEINKSDNNIKVVLAPHDIGEKMIHHIVSKLNVSYLRYSSANEDSNLKEAKILIIDNIGMLASLYRYATIAYVGGAFKQGLHNILEPAIYGIPVIFGPETKGFPEADEMLREGGAFSVSTAEELGNVLNELIHDKKSRLHAGMANKRYMDSKTGVTEKIMTNARVLLTRRLETAS